MCSLAMCESFEPVDVLSAHHTIHKVELVRLCVHRHVCLHVRTYYTAACTDSVDSGMGSILCVICAKV